MDSIEELRDCIAPIARKYQLKSVYLFGSYARREATESSDVDILIDRTGSKIHGMFDMGGLYNDLKEKIGKEIDLVTTATLQQQSTQARVPWFVQNVRTDMVKIYEHAG
ncbi:MAG: nucleotidyltransferase domain-containing protein [Oscillospiraceae bacterium]|nr:nucleotidyltransferase domain-containing protein [Oscillospiraceae bacterium]